MTFYPLSKWWTDLGMLVVLFLHIPTVTCIDMNSACSFSVFLCWKFKLSKSNVYSWHQPLIVNKPKLCFDSSTYNHSGNFKQHLLKHERESGSISALLVAQVSTNTHLVIFFLILLQTCEALSFTSIQFFMYGKYHIYRQFSRRCRIGLNYRTNLNK